MRNYLQKRVRWTTLFLFALALTGGTTMKAQNWVYDVSAGTLAKGDVTLNNVTLKEGTEKELVIGKNDVLGSVAVDLSATIDGDYKVTEIAEEAFSGAQITSFTCPPELESIPLNAFSMCTSLKSVTFNDKLTRIGETAFERAVALESVVLPRSLKKLDTGAFKSCSGLTSVTIPEDNQLTEMGESVFNRCSKLTSFTFPAGVTTINYYTFSMSGLTSFTVPATVTAIKDGAFSFVSTLSRIDCECVTEPKIDAESFVGGPEVRVVYALKADPRNWDKAKWGASQIVYEGGWAYDVEARTLLRGDVTLNNVTVRAGTEKELSIGFNVDFALAALDLSGVIDGDYTITELDEKAFYKNTVLTSVTLPSTLKTIGNSVFEGATKLAVISIPEDNRISDIGERAFSQTAITSFTLPAEVTVIKERAFNACLSLESFTFNDKLTEIGTSAFENAKVLKAAVLPLSLTTIGDNAFKSCNELATLTIPADNRITTLGASAFNRCTKLTSFTIPAGITKINNYLFSMSGLTSITLPAAITEIGNGGFSFCKELARIDCDQVTEPKIGDDVFSGGPEDRIVYALQANPQNWDKEKWGAKEIVYAPGSVVTEQAGQVRVWVEGGQLQLSVPSAERVRIVSADGISRDLGVVEGDFRMALPEGVSVVVVGDRTFKLVR